MNWPLPPSCSPLSWDKTSALSCPAWNAPPMTDVPINDILFFLRNQTAMCERRSQKRGLRRWAARRASRTEAVSPFCQNAPRRRSHAAAGGFGWLAGWLV